MGNLTASLGMGSYTTNSSNELTAVNGVLYGRVALDLALDGAPSLTVFKGGAFVCGIRFQFKLLLPFLPSTIRARPRPLFE